MRQATNAFRQNAFQRPATRSNQFTPDREVEYNDSTALIHRPETVRRIHQDIAENPTKSVDNKPEI